ncbi:MAG: radical SAM protein [Candidatus Omnitrophica bacterium]|nr:radical SAM protein [Candidatus Omnitrophota bacterium]
MPFNITLSLTYRCNSRCKTCNIYKRKSGELTLEEWKKVFKNLGKNILWATISGGEPFLREDLYEIVTALYAYCRPRIINIPTNGILPERIISNVRMIAEHCRSSQIIINVSLDEIDNKHDEIRGIPGNYKKAAETFNGLKLIKLPNLSVGIHTVISKFNVSRIPQIYAHLKKMSPDSYITEIAEEREELQTINSSITPEYNDYAKAVGFLAEMIKKDKFSRISKLTQAFRLEYYRLVKKILKEKRQVICCYAGCASAQISPDGEVWMCCIRAQSCGNLKDAEYDFKRVWMSPDAKEIRKSIMNKTCYCPLANAGYTNMLFSVRSLLKVFANLIGLTQILSAWPADRQNLPDRGGKSKSV